MNQTATAARPDQGSSGTLRFHSRARTIQAALPIVARVIGRKLDVEVTVGGSKARTNGKIIELPTLPFDDPDVETLAFGYLEHEAGHVRYTKPVTPVSNAHHGLWNILEDVRVERKLTAEYPGFADTLKKLMSKLVESGYFKTPQEGDSPASKLGNYLLYRLRAELLDQASLQDYATRAEALFRQSFPEGACVRIGSVIGRVQGLTSSQDALQLAGEILNIVDEESQDPPPPPEPPHQGNEEDTKGNADGSDGEPSLVDDAAQKRGNLRQILDAETTDIDQDIGQMAGEALNQEAAKVVASDGGAGVGRAELPLTNAIADPASVLAEVSTATVALSTRLRSFVESARHAPRGYKRQGNRPDPRRYVRAMCGNLKVFRSQQPEVDVNTAVIVLLDRSDSMEHRIAIANQSTLAAAAALATIKGIAVAAAAFPGRTADVELLTRFSDSVKRTAHRYRVVPSGGTPLLPALLWAADELLNRAEPRKIVLVITDGDPAHFSACQDGIARCWRGGIETYGIGIQVPDIRALFPISRSISTLDELAPAIFGVLQEALTRKAVA